MEKVYRKRIVDAILDELQPQLPAILLDGPKAVGKTTTALERAKTSYRLDTAADYQQIEADPERVVLGERPVLVDEWQKIPETWGVVKRAVDRDYSGGQFFLTGSRPGAGLHSGAGRITAVRMRPLSFAERDVAQTSISLADLLKGGADISGTTNFALEDYAQEMLQSGFPAFRTLSGHVLRRALDGYIQNIVEADIQEFGFVVRRPKLLFEWMRAYAAASGTTASWNKIRDAANSSGSLSMSRDATVPYVEALTRLRILDELPAWIPGRNHLKRVGSASKHYLADPALALRLLNFDAENVSSSTAWENGPYDSPLLGRIFESIAVMSIRTYADASSAKAMHFRDHDGRHEVDLIIERSDGKVLAIEVKLGTAVKDSDFKHLKWLKQQIGAELIESVVLYTGKHAYRKDGIAVIPLALLGP